MKDVPKAIEAVWKIESTRLIAAIARVTHDIGIAEELAQDAAVPTPSTMPTSDVYGPLPARLAQLELRRRLPA